MGISFADILRTARANVLAAMIDGGSAPGKLLIFSAPRPMKGAAVTGQILLAELLFSNPSGTVVSGVFTASLADDSSANATGLAAWARIVDGDEGFVADASITDMAGTGPIKMQSLNIYAGGIIHALEFQVTEGNI